jgi:hypothetical protein
MRRDNMEKDNKKKICSEFKKIILSAINKRDEQNFYRTFIDNIDDDNNFEIFVRDKSIEGGILMGLVEAGKFSLENLVYRNKDYKIEVSLFQKFLDDLGEK